MEQFLSKQLALVCSSVQPPKLIRAPEPLANDFLTLFHETDTSRSPGEKKNNNTKNITSEGDTTLLSNQPASLSYSCFCCYYSNV